MNKFSYLNKYIFVFTLFIVLFSTNCLLADHRNFVWTYEYMIMDKGLAELETYTTFNTIDIDSISQTTNSELNLEFEVGMLDFWDVAVYQNFKQAASGNLQYNGFKIRNRFKIGKQNQFFLDPLIYIEYATNATFSKQAIEPKLILAKTFNNFTFSLNPYCEFEYEDEEWEFVPKYAAGASYKLGHTFNLGFEVNGSKDGNYIGPTISHGSSQFWFAWGTLWSYGDLATGKPEFKTRLIMGFQL